MSNARRLARSVGDLLASQMIARAAVFLLFLVLARVFTKPELGLYALAFSCGYLASAFSELGLRTLILREASLDSSPGAIGSLIADVATLRILGGGATAIGVWLLLEASGYPGGTIHVAMLGVAMAWVDAFNQNLKTVFRAQEKTRCDRQSTLLGRFLNVALVLALVLAGAATVELVLLASIAAFLSESLYLANRLRVEAGAPLRLSAPTRRLGDALRAAWAFWLTAFAMEIARRLAVVALERYHGESAAAVFGAAHRLFDASAMIPVAVGAAVFPRVARVAAGKGSGRSDRPDLSDPAQRSAASRAYAAILFLLLALLAGPALMASLNAERAVGFLYGAKYLDAAPAFGALGWWLLFLALSSLAGNALILGGRQVALFGCAAATALLFLFALWGAIVSSAGDLSPGGAAERAALCMAASEAFFLLLVWLVATRHGLIPRPRWAAPGRDTLAGSAWLAASLAVCGGAAALANQSGGDLARFSPVALAIWIVAGLAHGGCCLGAFAAARRYARGSAENCVETPG